MENFAILGNSYQSIKIKVMLSEIFAKENIAIIAIFGSVTLIATFIIAFKTYRPTHKMSIFEKVNIWTETVLLFIYLLIEVLLIIVVFYLISLMLFP